MNEKCMNKCHIQCMGSQHPSSVMTSSSCVPVAAVVVIEQHISPYLTWGTNYQRSNKMCYVNMRVRESRKKRKNYSEAIDTLCSRASGRRQDKEWIVRTTTILAFQSGEKQIWINRHQNHYRQRSNWILLRRNEYVLHFCSIASHLSPFSFLFFNILIFESVLLVDFFVSLPWNWMQTMWTYCIFIPTHVCRIKKYIRVLLLLMFLLHKYYVHFAWFSRNHAYIHVYCACASAFVHIIFISQFVPENSQNHVYFCTQSGICLFIREHF